MKKRGHFETIKKMEAGNFCFRFPDFLPASARNFKNTKVVVLFFAFFAIPLCVKARNGVFLCSHGGLRLSPPWQGLFRVQEGKRKITDAQKPPRKSLETTLFFAKSSGSLGFPQVFPPFISLWPPAPPPPFFLPGTRRSLSLCGRWLGKSLFSRKSWLF